MMCTRCWDNKATTTDSSGKWQLCRSCKRDIERRLAMMIPDPMVMAMMTSEDLLAMEDLARGTHDTQGVQPRSASTVEANGGEHPVENPVVNSVRTRHGRRTRTEA